MSGKKVVIQNRVVSGRQGVARRRYVVRRRVVAEGFFPGKIVLSGGGVVGGRKSLLEVDYVEGKNK